MTGVIIGVLGIAALLGGFVALINAPEIARWWRGRRS